MQRGQQNLETVPLPPQTAPAPGAWVAFWRTLTKFEAGKLDAQRALRNTLGVVLPLAVGVLTGHPLGGLVVATGALNVAFSDDSSPYRERVRRMVTSSVVCSLAAWVGMVTGSGSVVAVIVATLWAFSTGMLVALGTTAADVGTISLVVLVVFAARPAPPEQAIGTAMLAFGGGIWQTLLSSALWPVRRYVLERRALGNLYAELAQVAPASAAVLSAPPATGQSTQAQQTLASIARDHSHMAERYQALLHEAERIRLSLLALQRVVRRWERESGDADALRRALDASAHVLSAVSTALLQNRRPTAVAALLDELHGAVETHRRAAEAAPPASFGREGILQLDALAGQLRAALDIADGTTPEGEQARVEREERAPWSLRFTNTWAILRANLTPQGTVWRHAVRLAVCIALGDSLGRGLGLQRAYWLPMTIAIVLKPDFTATFSRGVLRLAGTIGGLLIATGLFHLLPSSTGMQLVWMAVFTFLLRWVGPANYGVLTVAVSAMIVFLLGFSGVTPGEVVTSRSVNTVLGGVLALVVYGVWPTWERTQIGDMLGQLVEAYRAYFRAVMDGYVSSRTLHTAQISQTRHAARLARSNAEASVDRLSVEPRTSLRERQALTGILTNSHRFIHATMALEAGLYREQASRAVAPLRPFVHQVDLTLYLVADGLRRPHVPLEELPDLRAAYRKFLQACAPEPYALLTVETDRIVDSVNTLREQVVKWREQTGSPRSSELASRGSE